MKYLIMIFVFVAGFMGQQKEANAIWIGHGHSLYVVVDNMGWDPTASRKGCVQNPSTGGRCSECSPCSSGGQAGANCGNGCIQNASCIPCVIRFESQSEDFHILQSYDTDGNPLNQAHIVPGTDTWTETTENGWTIYEVTYTPWDH